MCSLIFMCVFALYVSVSLTEKPSLFSLGVLLKSQLSNNLKHQTFLSEVLDQAEFELKYPSYSFVRHLF